MSSFVLDFDVQRCTRRCASSDAPLEAGEMYYSVLVAEGSEVVRRDYSQAGWQGPPEDVLGWWAATIPSDESAKPKLAPSEVALQLFERWRQDPNQADATYVLALLLVRRRVLKFADSPFDNQANSNEFLQLYCPSRASEYKVPILEVSGERADHIQQQLIDLLYDNG